MIESVKPNGPVSKYERSFQVTVKGTNDRRVPVVGGRGYRVETGEPFERGHLIEIEIDVPAIVRELGRKALQNSGGVSRDGHVTVRRVGPRVTTMTREQS